MSANTNNTKLGQGALETNTNGSNNTAVGAWSGAMNTTGDQNTALGTNALLNNDSSTNNTALGVATLMTITTTGDADNNTAVGANASEYLTEGSNNVSIGAQAMFGSDEYGTTAKDNVAIGYRALMGITGIAQGYTGHIAIGTGAGQNIISGSNNIFMGYNAGKTHQSTTGAIGIGKHALGGLNEDEYTGNQCVAVGYESMAYATTAARSVAVGSWALGKTTIGTNNTAVGLRALEENTTGNNNTAIGDSALLSNVDGYQNIAIGEQAYGGAGATTGSQNIAIGHATLYNNTADDNVAVGFQSGYNNTGEKNTFVGASAGYNETTGKNVTCIGYNTQPSGSEADNEVTLGNTDVNSVFYSGLLQPVMDYTSLPNPNNSSIGYVGQIFSWTQETGVDNLVDGDFVQPSLSDFVGRTTAIPGIYMFSFNLLNFYNGSDTITTNITIYANGVVSPPLFTSANSTGSAQSNFSGCIPVNITSNSDAIQFSYSVPGGSGTNHFRVAQLSFTRIA